MKLLFARFSILNPNLFRDALVSNFQTSAESHSSESTAQNLKLETETLFC